MKISSFFALTMVGVGVVTLGVGLMSQESEKEIGSGFGVQTAETYRDMNTDLGLDFDSTFAIQQERGSIFQVASNEEGGIDVGRLLTISKWKNDCETSELQRVGVGGESTVTCGDGVLQTISGEGDAVSRNFLQGDINQLIQPGDKVGGEVVVAEDALLHGGKLVGIESFALTDEKIPTEVVSAMYTEEGVLLSVKKITAEGVSTVFQKRVEGTRSSTIGIGLTEDGSLFFEVDTIIYTSDYDITSQMHVSIVTQAKGAGLKNIDFE